MNTQQDSQDLLTSGSAWFNGTNEKMVTVLLITNQNVGPKFLEANPPQVVFLTDNGSVISQRIDHFLKKHTFFNVVPEIESAITAILTGEIGSEEVNEAEAEAAPASTAPKAIQPADVVAAQAIPVDLAFLTLADDDRPDSKVSSKALVKEIISVEQSPVIVSKDGGLVMVGSMFSLKLRGYSAKSEALVRSLFDPMSETKHFAGIVIDSNESPINYLGTTVSQDATGKHLVINLASLEEAEPEVEELPDAEEPEAPVVEKEQSLDDIAEAMSSVSTVASAAPAPAETSAPAALNVSVGA